LNNQVLYSPPEALIYENYGFKAEFIKKAEINIKNMNVVSVCDKVDIWAVGVLFLDMLTKERLSNT